MIFLIEYDRKKGKLISFQTFEDCERDEAQETRLDLELRLFRRGVEREVVILEAESEELIRRTHARYFYTLRELIEKFKSAVPAA
ncbi:MAG: hypothetical protein WAM70_11520 [Pyrinomonadaceae bacterium]